MNKKTLELIVQESLTDKKLDREKVFKIANRLSRTQLKQYIHALKKWMQENTVIVQTAGNVDEKTQKELQTIFENKQVEYEKNPELILGTTIIDNDIIYRMNLKDTLSQLQNYITHE